MINPYKSKAEKYQDAVSDALIMLMKEIHDKESLLTRTVAELKESIEYRMDVLPDTLALLYDIEQHLKQTKSELKP